MSNKCKDCGGPMLELFTSVDCRDKCYDKPKRVTVSASEEALNALAAKLQTQLPRPCLHHATYGVIGSGIYHCIACGANTGTYVAQAHYDQATLP